MVTDLVCTCNLSSQWTAFYNHLVGRTRSRFFKTKIHVLPVMKLPWHYIFHFFLCQEGTIVKDSCKVRRQVCKVYWNRAVAVNSQSMRTEAMKMSSVKGRLHENLPQSTPDDFSPFRLLQFFVKDIRRLARESCNVNVKLAPRKLRPLTPDFPATERLGDGKGRYMG